MLTSRMKKTLHVILSQNDFVTLKSIADELNVSTRTLLREVDDIAAWTESQGGTFIKKKGQGVLVDGDASERTRLLTLLNSEQGEIIYSPTERCVIIKAEMLYTTEPIKMFALTGLLSVTESTVANDIASIESWFNSFGIQVIRRPGLGVLLDGEEKSFRKAIVSLVYEQIPFLEMLGHLKGKELLTSNIESIKSHINKSLFKLIDLEALKYSADMLMWLEQEIGIRFADNAFITLVIRMSCTMSRLSYSEQIKIPQDKAVSIIKDRIYQSLKKYASESELAVLSDNELMLLSIHIKGAKLRDTGDEKSVSMIEDFKVIQLVKEFISAVEADTGLYLADNEALMFGMVKHLRPAIYRMKMDLDIINPLLKEIKEEYPKLFAAVNSCKRILEEKEQIIVPEEEVAYLATHIGAFIEKDERDYVKKYRVILACMYGIGASQLLVSNLKSRFPNINIISTISIIDYKIKSLNLEDADLIISTEPIEDAVLPTLVVNPILKGDDIRRIDEFLISYKPTVERRFEPQIEHYKEKFKKLSRYNEVLQVVLDEFAFLKKLPCKDLQEVIDYASRLIATSKKEEAQLRKSFEAREERGTTILSKKGMILLHCRSNIKPKVSFKILQFESPVAIESIEGSFDVTTIVVMVGPRDYDEIVLDVLSEVSRSIITSELSATILEGDTKSSERMIGELLNKYYENKVLNL